MSYEAQQHPALLTKILVKINEPENEKYQREVVDFFSPILYMKQKFKPVIGAYKKVKMNYAREAWTPEVELTLSYLEKEVPPEIPWCMDILITKIRYLSNNKKLNEDIIAVQVSLSKEVVEKVPKEIMHGFLQAHQDLRDMNRTIQVPGPIMEESAYRDYENSLPQIQELFPKSGMSATNKQRFLDFIATKDKAKMDYATFIKHPVVKEILQRETISKMDATWTQILPILGQYIKSIEHVEALWKVRYQFESLLPIYV